MTILRKAEHAALANVSIQGRVLDLGGDARSEYRAYLSAATKIVTVDLRPEAKPDIVANLEEPLPIPDASFDTVLLINVLEHIFEYRALLAETARVLASGGSIVVVVPYLFPNHPSPDDFHRYSASALRRALAAAGYTAVSTVALGTGVFAARWLFIERLLPRPLAFLSILFSALAQLADALFTTLARVLGKKYDPADYALGFLVTASKP